MLSGIVQDRELARSKYRLEHVASSNDRRLGRGANAEIATMKWALLAVAVFVCAFALFAAVPRPVMLGVFDAAGHSFGAVVNVVGRVADRATGQVDRVDTPAGSRRTETFAADLSGRARVIDGDTIELGAARGASAWGGCAGERTELSCRRRTLALRASGNPGTRRTDRRADSGMRTA